ncbi:MAG: hypothetical protein M1834_003066 [Cirrosporium novae-zelandiae]|nr:MAG: hypothetical protein M1834_003066 [Cirrosporium novae-zelandiae]
MSLNGIIRPFLRGKGAANHLHQLRQVTSKPIIQHEMLSYYWDTIPPTRQQLQHANIFFRRNRPNLFYSASKFFMIPSSSIPEVAMIGRSNVGKSSLINALLYTDICQTSSKPGRTKTMNAFSLGGEKDNPNSGKLVLLDMPGYGKASRGEWGTEIMKYLRGRKQLRRVFVLVDAMHGVKSTDLDVLALLRRNGVSHQVVLSKADCFFKAIPGKQQQVDRSESRSGPLQGVFNEVRRIVQPPGMDDGPPALGELVGCSTDSKFARSNEDGVASVRWAILSAAGINPLTRKKPVAVKADAGAESANLSNELS